MQDRDTSLIWIIAIPVILVFLLILYAHKTYAFGIFAYQGGAGAYTSGGACATPSTGSFFNEGFVADNYSGYENTPWTSSTGAGDTVNPNASLPGSPPAAACTEGLLIDHEESLSWAQIDFATPLSATGTWDLVMHAYIDTMTTDADITTHTWGGMYSAAGTEHFGFTWRNNLGANELRVEGSTDSNFLTVTSGTWHTITVHNDATAGNSYLDVDGSSGEFTRNSGPDVDVFAPGRYGWRWTDVGDHMQIYFGYIYVNEP